MWFQSSAVAAGGVATTVTEAWQRDTFNSEAEWPRYPSIVRRYWLHAAGKSQHRLNAVTHCGRVWYTAL